LSPDGVCLFSGAKGYNKHKGQRRSKRYLHLYAHPGHSLKKWSRTMSNLANVMEDYLKKLLTLSAYGYIEIKRKELATKFSCVPSQVNYVLETRFTLEKGFLVESKRGGKGFVSIKKLNLSAKKLLSMLMPEIQGGRISNEKAKMLLRKIYEEKYISFRELKLMETVLDTLGILEEEPRQALLRSLLLKNMLIVLTGQVY
jgi:transcriptional regulator CtsR